MLTKKSDSESKCINVTEVKTNLKFYSKTEPVIKSVLNIIHEYRVGHVRPEKSDMLSYKLRMSVNKWAMQ